MYLRSSVLLERRTEHLRKLSLICLREVGASVHFAH